jgi:hypothetical protein
VELDPLDRLSEVFSQHVICWAVLDSDLSAPNSLFYKKHLTLMCLVRLLLDSFPLVSSIIALMFS